MRALLVSFVEDESAAAAIEYGLIVAGIAAAIIASVNGVGTAIIAMFGKVTTALK